jgi:hypothetical protein
LYWDGPFSPGSVFATSTDSSPPSSGVLCNDEDVAAQPWQISDLSVNSAKTTFELNFSNNSCSTVAVEKNSGATSIESYGHNTCDLNNPRRVERAIRVSY